MSTPEQQPPSPPPAYSAGSEPGGDSSQATLSALDLIAEAVRRADRAEVERDEARRSCDGAWEDRRRADLALEREKQERAPLRAEIRQLREAMSHHRQIAEHYRDALAEVVRVTDLDLAWQTAQCALDNVPEWNGVLHA